VGPDRAAAAARASTLEVRGLGVTYDGAPALRDVELAVAPGEVLALLGPSGSGKSSLLHAVAGFLAPSAGEVWLAGSLVADPSRMLPPERRDVAVVFQQNALWPHLSAVDTVAYPMRRRGADRASARRRAQDLLDRLGVGHLAQRRPAEISGGEQQRVGLARALARDASLYLFDEPTAHLDTHVRDVFLEEMVARQRAAGAAAVYSTHDGAEALALADRVALLDGGRVVQLGTPEQVYAEPVDEWAARLTGPASVLATARGRCLVRPEWAVPDGPRPGRLLAVRYRGPWSDLLVDTDEGRLLMREPGRSARRVGEALTWRLLRTWVLPEPAGAPPAQPRPDPQPSTAAGPE
jgi:ABC-type Fe3+/spermidine/putrescine transport system ATPase subunit